jgi:hypothetical protein
MLRPAEDRLNYSDLLTPPSGFEVDFAIGTTYSLDLEALVGVPLSLSLSEEMDRTFQDDPLYVLEGIRRSADRFALFCEAGQMKVPQNQNVVFALMENSVFEVALKNEHSFHPKVWVIKYKNSENQIFYRLLVLTRNLTFDRSWDMALSLEGKRNNKKTKKNRPLADFLTFLLPFAKDKAKRRQMNKIIKELDYVHFDPADKKIPEFDFYPLGIPGYESKATGLFENYHHLLVFSPFISKSTLVELNQNSLTNATKVLITRRTELHKLNEKLLEDFEVYCLKDIIVEGEGAISGESAENEVAQLQDIHAKMYARTKYNEHHFYLGSANCSRNAFHGNVEFLLKLKYQKYGFRISTILDELFGEDERENPFERIDSIPENLEPDASLRDKLEKGIKQLVRLKPRAFITPANEHYSIQISFKSVPEEMEFRISPLLSRREAVLEKETIIEQLSLLELGSFYKVVAAKDGEKVERIIKIQTEGIPEERSQEIFRSIIKDPYTFLKYVAFLLSDDFLLSALEQMEKKKTGIGGWNDGMGDYPVLYENMLKAASRSPEKLQDVENVINLIKDHDIIPAEFEHLYATFLKATKKVKR